MIVINNIDSQRFTFNGVEYYKNFTPIVIGTKIRILNAYDSTIELTDSPRLFSEFEVNGLTYANVNLLQSALLPILYSRNTLGGGGGAWGSITGTLSDQTDLQNALDLKQDVLTEVNFGDFMDNGLSTKLTPSPNDPILARDLITNEAVEIPNGYQTYKTISANTTIDDTYHGALVWVTATSNITIPSGLRADFYMNVRTFDIATASYLPSGTVINSQSDGTIQAPSTMANISTFSTDNLIISGGGLS